MPLVVWYIGRWVPDPLPLRLACLTLSPGRTASEARASACPSAGSAGHSQLFNYRCDDRHCPLSFLFTSIESTATQEPYSS